MNPAVDHSEVTLVRFSEEQRIRKILAAAHKLFDPIGFMVPVVLIPKLLIRELWQDDFNSDAPFPGAWAKIAISRCVTKDDAKLSLHNFCVVCHYAYAAVVFLRVESSLGKFILVAPAKNTLIPRLELLATAIATRLASKTAYHLGIDGFDINFRSDSASVLTWIQQEENWLVFVHNRVREIRQLSN
ncbi:hypothetical protein PR048_023270 [Dryococelus australis]|uniref:RNase H type-1 domain-containing protein n=1 Tax=Dryococelus australis TaxID=614101 RepID=A0ABQ9GTL7_9NEOP|nr:hypothetical protein PR048_023270 [Dryococelus australis]